LQYLGCEDSESTTPTS